MFVFWIIARSAVFSIIVVSKNKRYPEFILYGCIAAGTYFEQGGLRIKTGGGGGGGLVT